MVEVGWRFPPLSGGTRQGYTNNDIEVFKGQELMDNLAREICQNSLDAKDDSDVPVKVVFELKKVKTSDYSLFSEYQECLDGCRRYWGDEMDARLSKFLSEADKTISADEISLLVASDYNTKGLDGSYSQKLKSPWEALTSSDGMSVKNEEDSGGSYGIGKNAPFACSSLSMVFYNTYANDGGNAFVGVARLATLMNKEDKPTQRVGKYQVNNDDDEIWTPIYTDTDSSFRDLFRRENEKGTDVIVAGFNQETDWMENVTKAVLKNFFVAISEEKLIVELKDKYEHKIIEKTNISQLFDDYENNGEMVQSTQLYKAFTNPDSHQLLEVINSDDVEVYVKSDNSYKRVVANFRSTGMLVGTYSKRIFQHYAAVVIVRGKELGELLKDTEPPRHNRWDYKLINASEVERRKKARTAIRSIEDQVLELLKSQFESFGTDTIDAAGVGEYLPDTADNSDESVVGDDLLKPKIKLGKIRKARSRSDSTTVEAGKEVGGVKEGDVHNDAVNPTPPPPKPWSPPKPVDPDNTESEQREGVVRQKGTKTMKTPEVKAQRAYPINASEGLYKIIMVPSESYENLYLSCAAVGEDGKSDLLNIESLTCNGYSIAVNGGKAGPISVEADETIVVFAKFTNREKMILKLQLEEVPKG